MTGSTGYGAKGGYDTDFRIENPHLIPQAKLEQLPSIGPLSVWKVSGKMIRDWIFIDFTEGGNTEAYPWMPPAEIWLDDSVWLPQDEHNVVLLHELTEYNLMHNKGWTYAKAHDAACEIEMKARRDPGQYSALMAAETVKAGGASQSSFDVKSVSRAMGKKISNPT